MSICIERCPCLFFGKGPGPTEVTPSLDNHNRIASLLFVLIALSYCIHTFYSQYIFILIFAQS